MNAKAIAAKIATELKEHPERWLQGTLARSSEGVVAPTDPCATSWCLHGFVRRELNLSGNDPTPIDVLAAFELAAVGRTYNGQPHGVDFPTWQDEEERTVADIIAVCEKVAS